MMSIDGEIPVLATIDNDWVSELTVDSTPMLREPAAHIVDRYGVGRYSLVDGSQEWYKDLGGNYYGVGVEPTNLAVYAITDGGTLYKKDTKDGSDLYTANPGAGKCLAVLPDLSFYNGNILYIADQDSATGPYYVNKLYQNLGTGYDNYPSPDLGAEVFGLGVGPGEVAYAGLGNSELKKLDSYDGEVLWTNTDFTGDVQAVVVGPNGNYVYAGSADGDVRKISDANSVSWTFTNHTGDIFDLALGRNGNYLYSVSLDNTVRKIDVSDGGESWSNTDASEWVKGVDVGPLNNYVYTVDIHKELRKIAISDGNTDFSTYLDHELYGISVITA